MEDEISDAELAITADDDYQLYLNAEFVTSDEPGSTTDWQAIEENPFISDYLRKGRNEILVKVHDIDRSGGGLWIWMRLGTVPEITDDMPVSLPVLGE